MSASRSVIGRARKYHSRRDKVECIFRRLDKYHRHSQVNPARKVENNQSWPPPCHDSISSFPWGLPPRSKFSVFLAGQQKGFWNREREQLHDRIAHLKKNVSEDGYYASFVLSRGSVHGFLTVMSPGGITTTQKVSRSNQGVGRTVSYDQLAHT